MRILFTCTSGVGHLFPMLSMVRAAVAAGHEVKIGTGPRLAGAIRTTGVDHIEMGKEILAATAAYPWIDALPVRQWTEPMWRHIFPGELAEAMAAGILAAAGSWRPDVIVREDSELGATVAADVLGIPQATIQAPAWRPEMPTYVAERLNAVRRRHGLPDDPAMETLHPHLYLTQRPRSLRAFHEPYPPTTKELRPMAADDVGAPPDGGWLPSAPDLPRIGVTFGTVHLDRVDLHVILSALADMPVEVVVGLGADPGTIGAVPSNVRVVAYVPMSRLLPTCSALIFHGGSGSMTAALVAGVPQVIIPLAADQGTNADACRAAGVAVVIERDELSVERVRTAVEATGAVAMRARVEAVRGEIEAMPPPEEALAWIEGLVDT